MKSFRVLYHLWQRQINDEMNNNSNLSKIQVHIRDSQHLLWQMTERRNHSIMNQSLRIVVIQKLFLKAALKKCPKKAQLKLDLDFTLILSSLISPDLICTDLTCPYLTCPILACPELTCPELICPDLNRHRHVLNCLDMYWVDLTSPDLTWPVWTWLDLP